MIAGAAVLGIALLFVPGPARAELAVPERDPQAVRVAVKEVLARPEFGPVRLTPVQRLQRWVAERIQSLLNSLAGGTRGTALTGLVVVAGLVALAAVALRFARGVTRDPSHSIRGPVMPRRTGADWRAEAAELERAGRWSAALRCRYRALVADLADGGVVEEVAGRTAGEYRSDVGSALPQAAADFAGATELFERAWYGNRPTGSDESERFRGLAERVLELAR
ncbi:MAG: DUF4129 domain-containing protein [Acidimicrobiales bacterium]